MHPPPRAARGTRSRSGEIYEGEMQRACLIAACLALAVLTPPATGGRPASGASAAGAERLDAWVVLQLPFDPARVRLRIVYSHVGGAEPADLPLPSPAQLPMFTELRVTVDGIKAERVRDENSFDMVNFEDRAPVAPGETKELM